MPFSGGGGGGTISPSGSISPPRPEPTEISWPTLSLEAASVEECLLNDGTGKSSFQIAGSVSLGTTDDSHAQEYYFVTVRVGGKHHGFLMPLGATRYFDDTIGPVLIGHGQISVTASAVMSHGPGTNITAPPVTIPVPGLCADLGFDSANPEDGTVLQIKEQGVESAFYSAQGFDGTSLGLSVRNPLSRSITLTVSGSVDDDVLFDGEVFEPGMHLYGDTFNGAHNFSRRITLAPGATVTIQGKDNFEGGSGISCTLIAQEISD